MDDSIHQAAQQHFLSTLRQSQLSHDPFPYIQLRDVFPTEYYQVITDNMPDAAAYSSVSGRNVQATCLQLFGIAGQRDELWQARFASAKGVQPQVQAFWVGLAAWLSSAAVCSALYDAVSAVLDDRPQDGDHCLEARLRFIKERDAVYIPPHLDKKGKLLTIVFYLQQAQQTDEIKGTILYRVDHKQDQLAPVVTIPYLANSASVIPRTLHSWHGVEPHLCPSSRNTLHLYLHECESD